MTVPSDWTQMQRGFREKIEAGLEPRGILVSDVPSMFVPTQVHGRLANGDRFYFRFRFGVASMEVWDPVLPIGPSGLPEIGAASWYQERDEWGDLESSLSSDEVVRLICEFAAEYSREAIAT